MLRTGFFSCLLSDWFRGPSHACCQLRVELASPAFQVTHDFPLRVSGVPPGSTVLVCPGTYPEQVTIAQPLTLKGISSGNAGQAVITVPGSGLAVVTTGFGHSIAAMVDVTAGPVNISDITVDGTGNNVTSTLWLAGFLYNDGSSGTANEVTARNLTGTGGYWGLG